MITFGNPAALTAIAALVAAAALVLAWVYRRRRTLGVPKLAGVALLAVCLLEPSWSTRHVRPGANVVLVLADDSRSLALHDRGSPRSRGEDLRQILARPWLGTLAENFQVRRYSFDARLRRSDDFSDLSFGGPASGIAAALTALADRHRGAPVAGVVLLSDGNATDLDGAIPPGLPPIYPVVIGGRDAQPDVALGQVTVAQTAFEDAPVTVQATMDTAGQAGATLQVTLTDEAGKVVGTQALPVSRDDETLTARFRLRPEKPGLAFYQVKVAARGGPGEATAANNARLVRVDRPAGPYRVLYVAGRPNWEYKFLRRALEADPAVQLVALIRVAHREPKFAFLGRGGETSNPLFRGFGARDDEAERYDQPVVVRLGTRDEAELRDGFPKRDQELFAYHAIILDDIEAGFFSADQHALVQRFVSDRGGGFLMLGGQESFRQGRYDRTPIGQVLPVALDTAPAAPPGPVTLQLTREGWLEPWTRLRDTETAERERLATLAPFLSVSRVGGAKPGAVVLATVKGMGDDAPERPALIAHRYGDGRAAAMTVGDLWRSALGRPEQQPDLGKLWRQTVRWLLAEVPARVTLRAEREAGRPMALRVRVRDRAFRPADDVQVKLEVTAPGGEKTTLLAEPAGSEPGLYEAAYPAERAGPYRARAQVLGPDGEVDAEAHAESGWVVDRDADEHRSIRANRALMEELARKTGGQVLEPSALDRFAAELPGRPAPLTEVRTRPLWDSWFVLLAALACFAGEWWLRRRRGLA